MGPAPFDRAWNLLSPTFFIFSSPMGFGNFSSHFVLMINTSCSTYERGRVSNNSHLLFTFPSFAPKK